MKALLVRLTVLVGLLLPGLALAEGKGYQATGKISMTETVTAADFQHIEGGPLLLVAYAVVWLIFFSTVVFLLVRMRRVARDLKRLEERVKELPEEPR